MQNLVYLLPVLGCAAMMGVMMLMMRGGHSKEMAPTQPDADTREEIAMLRAEIAVLRDQQTQPSDPADRGGRP